MFFNPLFLQVINNPESVNSAKAQKLNGASYLFSDIIKVAFEKTELESAAASSENGSTILNMGGAGQFDPNAFLNEITGGTPGSEAALYQLLGQVVPGNFKLGDLQGNNGIVGLPLVNNTDSKSIVLSENEVSSMISKFLEGNFQGKVSVLSGKTDQKKINVKSFNVSENSSLSPDELFSLLKDGNAVSLESSDAQNTKGLLITLYKMVSPEDSDSINETGMESEVSDADKKDAPEITEAASDYVTAAPEKYYKVEITVIDKTGYQELSSLEMLKTQAAGSMASAEVEKPEINPSEFNNTASRAFKIENGMTGPADMSGMNSFNEAADFDAQVNNAADPAADGSSKPAGTKVQSELISNTDQQPAAVTDASEKMSAVKNAPVSAVNNFVSEKTEENASGKINSQARSAEKLISGNKTSDSETLKTGTGLTSGINNAVSGKTEAPAGKLNRAESTVTAQEQAPKPVLNKKESAGTENAEASEEKTTVKNASATKSPAAAPAASQDDQNSTAKNVKSGVLKNLSLTLKSSRTRSGGAAENEITENPVGTQQKESVRNTISAPEKNIEETQENIEKDLKEFSTNISSRAFAKQMHDVANSVKENEIKTVNAGNEKQESSPVQNQDKTSIQQESDASGKETSHNLNEQASAPHKSDGSIKNPDTHFTTEMNKAAGAEAPSKPAVETAQNPLPSRLVKSTDVIKEISRFIEKNEGHSLTIKIDPESLGTVKIALDVVDKLVHANIEVENEAAKKMVESNLNQLYSQLSQSGIQLNSLNISLANQEGKQNKNFSGRKRQSNNDFETDFDQANVSDAKQMGYNTYEYTI